MVDFMVCYVFLKMIFLGAFCVSLFGGESLTLYKGIKQAGISCLSAMGSFVVAANDPTVETHSNR